MSKNEETIMVELPSILEIALGGGRHSVKLNLRESANPSGAVQRLIAVSGRAGNDAATSQGEKDAKYKGRTAEAERARDIFAAQYMMKLFNGETASRTQDEVLQYVRKQLKKKLGLEMKLSKMSREFCFEKLEELGKDPEEHFARIEKKIEEWKKEEASVEL